MSNSIDEADVPPDVEGGGSLVNRKRKCENAVPYTTQPGCSNPSMSQENDDLMETLSRNNIGHVKLVSDTSGKDEDDPQTCHLPFLPLQALRLEAIFYPKFDNEQPAMDQSSSLNKNNSSSPNKSMRSQMIERCRSSSADTKSGYIEVSLKHSGSLVLWSGQERFYSKNSTANLFTSVAEVLLRQHFHKYSAAIRGDSSAMITEKDLFDQCSNYVAQNRLTLSFELITSVLGDHGARPLHDFIILTAIADRSRVSSASAPNNIFYSTLELIEFAQRFHLPHNDYWIYSDDPSIQSLFDVYDTCRETGTTSTVIPALCAAAAVTGTTSPRERIPSSVQSNDGSDCDYYVQSMYPHADFQGEILEGIVIRYVPLNSSRISSTTNAATLEHIRCLAQKSRSILQNFRNICFDLSLSSHYTFDLRQLYRESKAAYSRKGVEDFEKRLNELMFQSSNLLDRQQRHIVQRLNGPSLALNQVELWIGSLLQQSHIDPETRRIASVIDSVSKLNAKVVYSIFHEQGKRPMDEIQDVSEVSVKSDSSRYICIVHVLHDETFYKYHRNKHIDALPLFRGFSFQLIGGETINTTTRISDSTMSSESRENGMEWELNATETTSIHDNIDESLMLKMKFLPYMIRTFACRNGLKVIRQVDGVTAFIRFTNNLMSKWGISDQARLLWRPFFAGWARYVQFHLNPNNALQRSTPDFDENDCPKLPPLSEYCYLDHFALFQALYNAGEYKEEELSKNRLQGLVVVVAPNSERAGILADYVAQNLGGARRIVGLGDINPSTVDDACNPGQGIVCNAAIEDGFGKVRKLLRDYADFISIVLFECSEVNLSIYGEEENKKLAGLLNGWKKTTCARVFDLPHSAKFETISSINVDAFKECQTIGSILSQLELPVAVDVRPGVLVFFPMVPGSGKSTYLDDIQHDMVDALVNRSLFVHEGDKMKGKFWPQLKKARRRSYSGIHVADKNAPPNVWGTIGNICLATKALAVPVLPNKSALQTTLVEGCRGRDGSVSNDEIHKYPFSLWYLAVCMARVLQRPAESHAGKLDLATKRSCLIVIKFYSFYRSLSADQFIPSMISVLTNAGAIVTPAHIEVPFFCIDPSVSKLPEDVELLLVEALRCQFGYDLEQVDTSSVEDEYLDDLEIRLRDVLDRYQDSILSSTVDIPTTREIFVTSLKEKISEADSISNYETPSFVKLAAIDIAADSVFHVLKELRKYERIHSIFNSLLGGVDIDDILGDSTLFTAESMGFVTKTHVTLAHCRDMSQCLIRSSFTPHLESTVELSVNSVLWNDRVMALSVNVSEVTSEGTVLPPSSNEFVHLTVWIGKEASAVEANSLPRLVDTGEAFCFEFPPYLLHGVVSFWDM